MLAYRGRASCYSEAHAQNIMTGAKEHDEKKVDRSLLQMLYT